MPVITFVMDARLLEHIGHGHLPGALTALGHKVVLEDRSKPGSSAEGYQPGDDECVVLYGSIEFVEQRMGLGGYMPGAYYSRKTFKCSYYLPRLPLELIGNSEGVYLPFAEFLRRRGQHYRQFGVSRLFIRPDSGAKTFTGLTLRKGKDDFELHSLKALTSVTGDTLIMVAPAAKISVEYRFYIVEGKVITGSRYMVNGEPSPSPDVDPACLAVAKTVAELPWQIDLAYTCDVGLFHGKPKIVELNAFSTSGLYQCDSIALFDAVANVAYKEYQGEISITC